MEPEEIYTLSDEDIVVERDLVKAEKTNVGLKTEIEMDWEDAKGDR